MYGRLFHCCLRIRIQTLDEWLQKGNGSSWENQIYLTISDTLLAEILPQNSLKILNPLKKFHFLTASLNPIITKTFHIPFNRTTFSSFNKSLYKDTFALFSFLLVYFYLTKLFFFLLYSFQVLFMYINCFFSPLLFHVIINEYRLSFNFL